MISAVLLPLPSTLKITCVKYDFYNHIKQNMKILLIQSVSKLQNK